MAFGTEQSRYKQPDPYANTRGPGTPLANSYAQPLNVGPGLRPLYNSPIGPTELGPTSQQVHAQYPVGIHTDGQGHIWYSRDGVTREEALGYDAANNRLLLRGNQSVPATPELVSSWNAATTKSQNVSAAANAAPPLTPEQQAAQAAETAAQGRNAKLDAEIDAYLAELKQPLNMNDPYVQQVIRGASSAAGTAARNRGVEGGLAGAATEQNTSSALAGLEAHRSGLYGQTLALANQRNLSQNQTALQRELGLKNLAQQAQQLNMQQNQYDDAAGLAAEQGKGALIGGLIGAVPGIIGAPFTGGASLGLIGAGAGIGAGAAGMSYKPRRRTNPSQGGY